MPRRGSDAIGEAHGRAPVNGVAGLPGPAALVLGSATEHVYRSGAGG
jgi:hypothetical protein